MTTTTIRLKGGTALEWETVNPILLSREVGVEVDTGKAKIGDGSKTWVDLPYIGQVGLTASDIAFNPDRDVQEIIEEIEAKIDIQSVPPGGLTGQVLGKLSDADYDNGWVDQDGLLATNNLSDLANVAAARTNLGLGTAATQASGAFDAAGTAAAEATARATADALLIPLAQKGVANGVATLGSDSKIPFEQIPAIALSEYLGTVASQAAMLALVGQRGDWCIRSDTSSTWVLSADDASQLGSWVELPSAGGVASVNGRTGVVTGLAEASDLAPLSDNPPSNVGAGPPSAGSANEAMRADAMLALDPDLIDSFVTSDVNGQLVNSISPGNPSFSAFVAKNTTGSGPLWQGYFRDGATLTSLITEDGYIRTAAGFRAIDNSVSLDIAENRFNLEASEGLWLLGHGAGITYLSPSGGVVKRVSLGNDGLFNTYPGPTPNGWFDDNKAFACKNAAGVAARTYITELGRVVVDLTETNGNALYDALVPVSVDVGVVSARNVALQEWKISGAVKTSVNKDGELENLIAGKGVVVARPDGTRRRIRLDNSDNVVVEAA